MTLTWKDVLDCKKWYGHISNMSKEAHDIGYKYFAWNGKVYEIIEDDDSIYGIDTGIITDDLK